MNRVLLSPLSSRAAGYAASHVWSTHPPSKGSRPRVTGLLIAAALFAAPLSAAAQASAYVQTNIISDGAVSAAETDPTLINPWGVSIGPQFWIDSPGSGFSLVDYASGVKDFAVEVPPANSTSPHGTPAGTVYNANSSLFPISGGYAQFLFGTLDGTIAAWNPSTPEAVTVIDNSAQGAVYTDIAVDTTASGSFLLAANFATGKVDVFNSSFASANLTGGFSDPAIPSGFSPFGIHAIGDKIFVTYAQRNAQGRENVGAGLGYVDAFDTEGNLLESAISQGNLNAPWGMALAPSGFGSLSGDLLVGNFGDGVINAYDPNTFAFIGQVQDASGNPIANSGLWEIIFGSSGVGDPNTLYFAAGINGEKDGLFGSIAVASSGAGAGDFTFTSSANTLSVTASQAGTVTLSLGSQNGFSGAVTLSCSGLPAGTSCSFSPSPVTLASSTTQNVAVSIAEASTSTNPYSTTQLSRAHPAITFAFLGPLAFLALAGFRKRSLLLSTFLLAGFITCLAFGVNGCSSSNSPAGTTTKGTLQTVQVMINATSGAITHSVPITVTFQ
ncbi:MAG: TIGR03118 family protein [Terracidiphilus sp.]